MLVEEFVDFLTSVMWSPGVIFFFSLSLCPIFDIHIVSEDPPPCLIPVASGNPSDCARRYFLDRNYTSSPGLKTKNVNCLG